MDKSASAPMAPPIVSPLYASPVSGYEERSAPLVAEGYAIDEARDTTSGPSAGSYGSIKIEPNQLVGSVTRRARPHFDPIIPLSIQHAISSQYFRELITDINNFKSKWDDFVYGAYAIIGIGFILFAVGGYLTANLGPNGGIAIVIIGFILFGAGGFLSVNIKRWAHQEYSDFVTMKCEEASTRCAPSRFRYSVVHTGYAHSYHGSSSRRVALYSHYITIEYPLAEQNTSSQYNQFSQNYNHGQVASAISY